MTQKLNPYDPAAMRRAAPKHTPKPVRGLSPYQGPIGKTK